jgi:hypothetical protein
MAAGYYYKDSMAAGYHRKDLIDVGGIIRIQWLWVLS